MNVSFRATVTVTIRVRVRAQGTTVSIANSTSEGLDNPSTLNTGRAPTNPESVGVAENVGSTYHHNLHGK
jgi:hypothetical protein